MKSGKFLLDTNIVIATINNEAVVLKILEKVSDFSIPSIVIGELYFGAEKSAKVAQNSAKIADLVLKNAILFVDFHTAKHYGTIKNHLKKQGTPIPDNDIWIAATAIQHDMILVSRDAHLQNVPDLKLEEW
jgi:tRNA(fMet)-specific endonuclease VapC